MRVFQSSADPCVFHKDSMVVLIYVMIKSLKEFNYTDEGNIPGHHFFPDDSFEQTTISYAEVELLALMVISIHKYVIGIECHWK